jgi:phospholipase/lecithinase/hemolysin
VTITRLDVYGIIDQVVAAPAVAGFRNVQDPCITPGTLVHPYCRRPDDYLFWDGIHPTRAGHHALAKRAAEALGAAHVHAASGWSY